MRGKNRDIDPDDSRERSAVMFTLRLHGYGATDFGAEHQKGKRNGSRDKMREREHVLRERNTV